MRVVYRPKHPNANENGMVDIDIAGPKHVGGKAHYIQRDEMDATRHMANGKYYTSKHKFREATKAAGCIEVGNETETVMRPRKPIQMDRSQRVRDIRQAIEQLRSRQ